MSHESLYSVQYTEKFDVSYIRVIISGKTGAVFEVEYAQKVFSILRLIGVENDGEGGTDSPAVVEELISIRDKMREAEAALRLRAKVVEQAVTDNWDVADEYENLSNGITEDPNLEKARKNVAEKRKKEQTPPKFKRPRGQHHSPGTRSPYSFAGFHNAGYSQPSVNYWPQVMQ